MAYRNVTLGEFADRTWSKEPAPGGGGVSAAVASLGAELAGMVSNFTTGKKKYAVHQQEIEESMKKADELKEKLLLSIDRDAEAFEPLSKAYSLPRESDEEKAYRDEVMKKALVTASEAPLEQMRLISDSMMLIRRISEIGSTLAISDAGAAIQFAFAALKASSLNVYINSPCISVIIISPCLF